MSPLSSFKDVVSMQPLNLLELLRRERCVALLHRQPPRVWRRCHLDEAGVFALARLALALWPGLLERSLGRSTVGFGAC
jgi:hypothetical protein